MPSVPDDDDTGVAVAPWQVVSSDLLLDRPWLRVHEQVVALPGGGRIDAFHLIEGPDWVAALVLDTAGRVVLIDQYRHGVAGSSRELPAGVIEPGETPLAAARRELLEETGYEADDWAHLLTVSTEPCRHTTRAHFYFARNARRVRAPRLDDTESIVTCTMHVADLLRAVEEGRLVHGVHVGAVLLAARRGWLGQSSAGAP